MNTDGWREGKAQRIDAIHHMDQIQNQLWVTSEGKHQQWYSELSLNVTKMTESMWHYGSSLSGLKQQLTLQLTQKTNPEDGSIDWVCR